MGRFFLFFLLLPITLHAQISYSTALNIPPDTAPEIETRAAVLIDAHTGTILYAKNPDDVIPPASLAKLMTMHIAMKEIKEGRASYDEIIPITVESWAQSQPSRSSLMFLEPGQTVTLRELLLGLAVVSGNDAAVAVALRFAPSMRDFANLMTEEARRMGLHVTRFVESSGISGTNITTAAEFAILCRNYISMHPHSMEEFHSVLEFAYPLEENVLQKNSSRPRTIVQENRNSLLQTFPGADGLKTGFINESGFNIAITAQREGTRFILVLLGGPSGRRGALIRANDSAALLNWAFDNFKTVYTNINEIDNVRLWKGKSKKAALRLLESPDFTAYIDRAKNLTYNVVIPNQLIAPIPKDFPVGYLSISDERGELSRTPLVTTEAYERGNALKRFWHSVVLLFKK